MYKVLIVDDEPYIPEGLKKMIPWEEYGLEVCEAAFNGQEAIEIIERTYVHIVITDMKMPVMDGIKLLKYIRESKLDIKCIVLSGYDDFQYVRAASLLGIENYFLKPVNKEELSDTILNTVKKIQNESRLKIKERQNLDVLRNNLILLWLNNIISTRGLLEKKDVVILNLDGDNYIAAIVKILKPDEIDRDLTSFAANNIIGELLQERDMGFSLCDINGNIILVFKGEKTEINLKSVNEFMTFAMDIVERNLGVELFGAIGGLVSDNQEVHISYQQAVRIMNNYIVFQNKRIVSHDNILCKEDTARQDKNHGALRNLINKLDKEGLIIYVYDMCLKLESDGADLALSQATITKFITDFLNELKIMNIDIEQLINECGNVFKHVFNSTSTDRILDGMLQLVDRVIVVAQRQYVSRNIYVNKAIDYIKNNYQKGLSLKIISNELNISPQYLGQMFIKETGDTFTNYLNNFRIARARDLLIHSNLKMNEISQEIGFDNTNYFYAVFKKACGVSPNEFRESNFHLGK